MTTKAFAIASLPFRNNTEGGNFIEGNSPVLQEGEKMLKNILIFLSLTLWSFSVEAGIFLATCQDPRGPRVDYMPDGFEFDTDGYTGSEAQFIFDSQRPKILIEAWQSTLVSEDLFTRKEVEKIAPTNAIRATVIYYDEDVVQAISGAGNSLYTTMLYPKLGIGIFTRQRRGNADMPITGAPMAAIYVAQCKFTTG